jgi:hypothetical protein
MTSTTAATLTTDDIAALASDYVATHDRWASTGIGHRDSARLMARMDRIMVRAEHAGLTRELVSQIDLQFAKVAR